MIESPLQVVYRRLFKPAIWHRLTAARRALPDFLVIGAMRSGTTSLHDLLVQHPEIVPGIKKEVHYFDLQYDHGERWYRAHFPLQTSLKLNGQLTGEASPYYLSHPLAPARAAATVPNAKLIVVLRNPIDRAYSHYWHAVRMKVESLDFEAAIEVEAERLGGEADRIRRQPGYRSFKHQHLAYLERSIYVDEITRWLAHFRRKQFLIFSREAFSDDPEGHSRQLFDFLCLNIHNHQTSKKLNLAQYPPMEQETRARLVDYFRPHNARLFALIGERFDWED